MPFQPIPDATVSVTATTSSAATAVPLGAAPRSGLFQVRVRNPATGADAFIRFGDSTVQASVSNSLVAPMGSVEVFTVPNLPGKPVTHVAAVTASGTAALTFTTGQVC